jgi:hypothetical protein
MTAELSKVRKGGFTIAPEAGSQRLRNVINKGITEEVILQGASNAFRRGWSHIKLYFMIGLPTEKDEDVLAIVHLMEKCMAIAQSYSGVNLNVSISPFSPKPHTPFQWEKQESPRVLQKRIHLLRQHLPSSHLKISWRDAVVTSLETALTRADRRMANVIEKAWQLGARFDGWNEQFDASLWQQAFQEAGVDWQKLLEPISITVPLPWDHIDMGVSKSFLKKEKLRAYEGKLSPDCKDYVCLGCGLQRKDFEKFVDCYKDLDKKAGKTEPSPKVTRQPGWMETPSAPEPPGAGGVSYGRKSRRRQSVGGIAALVLWSAALAAATGSVWAFTMTVRQAYTYDIVGPDHALNGMSLMALSQRVGGVVGAVVSAAMRLIPRCAPAAPSTATVT